MKYSHLVFFIVTISLLLHCNGRQKKYIIECDGISSGPYTFEKNINISKNEIGEIQQEFIFVYHGPKNINIKKIVSTCVCTKYTFPHKKLQNGIKYNIKIRINSENSLGWQSGQVILLTDNEYVPQIDFVVKFFGNKKAEITPKIINPLKIDSNSNYTREIYITDTMLSDSDIYSTPTVFYTPELIKVQYVDTKYFKDKLIIHLEDELNPVTITKQDIFRMTYKPINKKIDDKLLFRYKGDTLKIPIHLPNCTKRIGISAKTNKMHDSK